MDSECIERWEAHRREHALEKEALLGARQAQESARQLASSDIDRRLDEMNKLREQIMSERGAYPTRLEYDAKHDQLVQRMQTMETQLASLIGRMSLIAALSGTLVAVVVTVILKLVNI